MALAMRRLPGIRFEAEAPPPLTVLPRMDTAVFVGFAASGPIDVPVSIREAAQFEALFGRDAPLYWDEGSGAQVYAYLAPAVRAFFRNGGRRCFVVRVAGPDARAASFVVPALVARRADEPLQAPVLRARSEGSWADDLHVAAALVETPVAANPTDLLRLTFELPLNAAEPVSPGDLLRVTLRAAGYTVLTAVRSVDGTTVTGDPGTALWLQRKHPPQGARGPASFVDALGGQQVGVVRVRATAGSRGSDLVNIELRARSADLPAPGSLLRAQLGADELWVLVGASRLVRRYARTADQKVRLQGQAFWPVGPPQQHFQPGAFDSVEKLTCELWVRRGAEQELRLADLGFAPLHPRYLGGLPTDAQLYADRTTAPLAVDRPPLWWAAAEPRFPLAGPAENAGVFFPLGMPPLPDPYLPALSPIGSELARDGLADFGAGLFVDERLRGSGTEALLAQSDFILLGDEPPLRGVHATLALDEATIVVAPDAVHRGWTRAEPEPVPVPAPPAPAPQVQPLFSACAARHLDPPRLEATRPDRSGTFTLSWTNLQGRGEAYAVEEARDPGFADAVPLYRGARWRTEVFGRARGVWYYRVRVELDGTSSDWSAGVAVAIVPDARWQTVADADYVDDALVEVHRALLRLAAARGDVFALLSLPEHYREQRAIGHVQRLKGSLADGETRALGYGAVHHPWPTTSEPDDASAFRSTPPDGAIAGVLARRTFVRGAWIAPANDPLRDVVTLTPPLPRASLQSLQDAQLNVLRHEPHGFLVLSADTLAEDPELRPINVRRLLSLLRRVALLHGPRYVFEPNDDALRRRIERGFEELLAYMFRLGAFAGATASEAYRVEVGDPPNTPQSLDEGRLIVELKVAPSLPLRFLTVRLVERGERGLQPEAP